MLTSNSMAASKSVCLAAGAVLATAQRQQDNQLMAAPQDLDNHIHGDHNLNTIPLQTTQSSPGHQQQLKQSGVVYPLNLPLHIQQQTQQQQQKHFPSTETIENTSSNNYQNQNQNHQSAIENIISNNNTISGGLINSKKGASIVHHQSLSKLQKHLNEHQLELIKRNPGSLLAIARALKMAILECRYQLRHEPWDCPTFGFSVKPADIFGKLMSRSFKETSFIHSLLSAAIAHSIARACTESMISTCGRLSTRDAGFREDIDFGRQFSEEFMRATHEPQSVLGSAPSSALNSISSDRNVNNNIILSGNSMSGGMGSEQQQLASLATPTSGGQIEPTRRERRIRNMINAHNDEVGRLLVLNGMRRECKCHGLSGACSMQTCWLKLPPFRDVASKLHDSLDQAIRVVYVAHNPLNRQKSLGSTAKKSNKKRSSSASSLSRASSAIDSGSMASQPHRFGRNPSLGQPSQRLNYHDAAPNSLTSDTANIIGSRPNSNRRGTKRHTISADNCEDCYRTPVDGGSGAGSRSEPFGAAANGGASNGLSSSAAAAAAAVAAEANHQHDRPMDAALSHQTAPARDLSLESQVTAAAAANASSTTPVVKRRPMARSIGIAAYTISPSKFDLLYYEESPDFCIPSERYNIKGTKGRTCSESSNAINSCERLCCGRGYKTEVRAEEYKCECQFKFCCKLDCKICTRRKVIHKCL